MYTTQTNNYLNFYGIVLTSGYCLETNKTFDIFCKCDTPDAMVQAQWFSVKSLSLVTELSSQLYDFSLTAILNYSDIHKLPQSKFTRVFHEVQTIKLFLCLYVNSSLKVALFEM